MQVTDEGRPVEAEFVFTEHLESTRNRWFYYTDNGYEIFTPPQIGETIEIPAQTSKFIFEEFLPFVD